MLNEKSFQNNIAKIAALAAEFSFFLPLHILFISIRWYGSFIWLFSSLTFFFF